MIESISGVWASSRMVLSAASEARKPSSSGPLRDR